MNAHDENERRKHETESANAVAPAPKLRAGTWDPIIGTLIILARFLGMLQRTLGRGQTHLLSAAVSLGWQPGTTDIMLALEKRQASLAALEIFKAGKRRQRKMAKILRRKGKRG